MDQHEGHSVSTDHQPEVCEELCLQSSKETSYEDDGRTVSRSVEDTGCMSLSVCLSVCPSVCPSVKGMLVLYIAGDLPVVLYYVCCS